MDLSEEFHVIVCGLQQLISVIQRLLVGVTTGVVSVAYKSSVATPYFLAHKLQNYAWPPSPFISVT